MIGSNSTNVANEHSVDSTGWFAIRVKSNRDHVVTISLEDKGYETFLPKCRISQGPGASAQKASPLFPGYIFCRFDVTRRLPILMVPGVIHVVGIGKTPVSIPDDEIESIRLVVDSDLPVIPVQHFEMGERVRLDAGPLKGAVGTVTDRKRGLFVVSITILQRSISVALPPEWLTKMENRPSSSPLRQASGAGYNSWPGEGTCS